MTDLQEFRLRARESYEDAKRRRRDLYRLAKDLGFSTAEAKVLAGRSEAVIRNLAGQTLAEERAKYDTKNT